MGYTKQEGEVCTNVVETIYFGPVWVESKPSLALGSRKNKMPESSFEGRRSQGKQGWTEGIDAPLLRHLYVIAPRSRPFYPEPQNADDDSQVRVLVSRT